MIYLQVILGLLSLILTPIVLLTFFVQSRHILYRAVTLVLDQTSLNNRMPMAIRNSRAQNVPYLDTRKPDRDR